MIGLRIEFLAGRFHANPWDRGTNEDDVEWPPSPWRMLRALTAGWYRSGEENREAFLRILDRLAEPPVYELPRATSGHSRHYMPQGGIKNGKPETSLILDSFLALDRGCEPVATAYVIWPHVDFQGEELSVLESCCAKIGYLGRAESWASLAVVREPPLLAGRERVDLASRSSGNGPLARRLAAGPSLRGDGLLRALSETTAMMRKARRLVPRGSAWIEYRLPADFLMVREQFDAADRERPVFGPMLMRFGLQRGVHSVLPPITEAVLFADLMRKAAIKHLSQREGEPATRRLAGKCDEGGVRQGHDHPYFLPHDSNNHGVIDRIDVWFPNGCTHAEYRAVAGVSKLYEPLRYRDDFLVTFLGTIERPQARTWKTATPIVLERFPKLRGPGKSIIVDAPQQQVRDMLQRVTPQEVRIELWEAGSAIMRRGGHRTRLDAFRRTRVGKADVTQPPPVGATISFNEPIVGPLVLGRLAHFGLGRFVPCD